MTFVDKHPNSTSAYCVVPIVGTFSGTVKLREGPLTAVPVHLQEDLLAHPTLEEVQVVVEVVLVVLLEVVHGVAQLGQGEGHGLGPRLRKPSADYFHCENIFLEDIDNYLFIYVWIHDTCVAILSIVLLNI